MKSYSKVTIDEMVDIDPGNFWYRCFPAQAGGYVTIDAWELDGYDFDIFLLHEENICDDEFSDKYALIGKGHEGHFRGSATLQMSGNYCVVISCIRAREITREVRVRVTMTVNEAQTSTQIDGRLAPPSAATSSRENLSIKGVLILVCIVILFGFCIMASYVIHPGLAAAVTAAGGVLLRILEKKIRTLVGFQT